MPVHSRHRVGRYLIVDDESGIIAYDDQIFKRWDGALVRRKGYETRHPQEFVKAKRDPYPLKDVRMPEPIECVHLNPLFFVGNTNVKAGNSDLGFRLTKVGIGKMRIGCDFVVFEGPGQVPPLHFVPFSGILDPEAAIAGFLTEAASITPFGLGDIAVASAEQGVVASRPGDPELGEDLADDGGENFTDDTNEILVTN